MPSKQHLAMRLRLAVCLTLGLASLSSAVFAAGGNADALKAIELCKQGKEREALPFFENALRKAPADEQLFYNRALAYQTLGETDKSIRDFSSCLRLSPLNAKVYYKRALAYLARKDYSRAKRDLDRVIVIDGKNHDAFLSRGNLFFEVDQYQNALKDFDKSIELSPSPQAFMLKGNAELRLGLYQQAAFEYGEAIKLDPKATKALFERALLFLCQEKYPIAIKDAGKYIELEGWSDDITPYASFIKLFAAKLSKNKEVEKATVSELKAHSEGGKDWLQTISSYLVGKTSEKQLFAQAGTNIDKLTEAHAYVGMLQYCDGNLKDSKANFLWVIQKDNKVFDEYSLAKAMLTRAK